ncbi:conserved hypothetical protein [Histoplasma capsulatum G186AR]|uniref:C3H1-type domain-containing protein n=1 Tax=Ajellomyces capsulatus (strain G186AR / H82 / ATCC MYA-2454 / RMSCC 2432) TaxID=447093 RepID=C0NCX9_AJECG|nr:uncharacterized protein HCBG_00975 [Histoplasma capsulatum G186AR]EEH11520.1 conserved hypothetical protein [Histoplasma capsulatum G186AR]
MHTSRTQKKATACYYWYNGRCKYTADACMYAHRHTGQVAKRPPSTTKLGQTLTAITESKPDQRDNRDLISLVGNDDIIEDTISSAAATENSSCTIVLQTPAEASECLTLAEAVIKALQSNTDSSGIKAMLATNPPERVLKALNKGIDGFSAIFEAVKRNDADIIELLVENGANPNATEHNSDIPLLAFAILRDTRWYNRLHRASLLKRLDFGVRYHLLASSKLEAPTKNERRNAERLGIKSLLQLPYFSVGQRLAIKRVTEYVQSHLLLPSSNQPLMLAFVGPPGHGQLKLAASVGKIVPFNSIVARTKKMNNYSANEQIPDKEISTNKPSRLEVVYIDDIDKIGRLNLITLLNGPTQASSNTICILSVTDGESTILDFYETYLGNAPKDELLSAPWDELDKALKKDLLKSYGSSLTSHIDAIIPFFPYSDSEAEALAYKYINDLRSRLANADVGDNAYAAKPATANASTFLSAIHLDLEGDDRAICEHIAKKSYDMSLGERSIQQGVIREIQLPIIEQWIKKIPEAEESFRGYGQAPWCSGLGLGSPHSSTSMSTSGGAHALSAQGVTKAAVKLVANEHPDVMFWKRVAGWSGRGRWVLR